MSYFLASTITGFFIDTYYGTVMQISQLTGTMKEAEGVAYRMPGQMMEGCVSIGA